MARGRKKIMQYDSELREIEQYRHIDKERVNNPPVGLVKSETNEYEVKKLYSYDPHIDPSLQWSGKTEHTSFEVPSVSLHVHERIDPVTILNAVRVEKEAEFEQLSLFQNKKQKLSLREAVEFYKHKHNWTNRLIAGDSLLVMNSLIEKEGMGGQVQMIYFDPPYGIKYGSNFQPFINKKDVKDGKDEDLSQEPEMVKAFRDTWELGIHSYLTYIRDRLLLAKELLADSGSVFVQISDENVHLVRNVLDEVFGKNNFLSLITFKKKNMPLGSKFLEQMNDYIIWYCKNKDNVKFRRLYSKMNVEGDGHWNYVEYPSGYNRKLTPEEINNHSLLPENSQLFRFGAMFSAGVNQSGFYNKEVYGETYEYPKGKGWKTPEKSMDILIKANRVIPWQIGKTLGYKIKLSDYPVTPIDTVWNDTALLSNKIYAVQTSTVAIQKCMLMTTEPGDIVLDPTCGSGTSAAVAEQWGRRWITCDTSRVAITLAKQRLMTSIYDYYKLAYPDEGVGSGFEYETVPHITLGSIAENEDIENMYQEYNLQIERVLKDLNKALKMKFKEWEVPVEYDDLWDDKAKNIFDNFHKLRRELQVKINNSIEKNSPQETLYDRPLIDQNIIRVSGPFTVEAVPSPIVKPLSEIENIPSADETLARKGETGRQADWRDELLATGIIGRGGQKIQFSRVELLPGTRYLQAEAETKEDVPQRVVICFSNEHTPLDARVVELAIQEAERLRPAPKIIVFAAFQFDPEASKDIDEISWMGVTLLKVQMNTDLLTDDLKKKRSSNQSFWLIGQPDVELIKIEKGKEKGKYKVKIHGFDYYDVRKGIVESGDTEKIAVWMLDTDYDGRSIFPKQVFFPMSSDKEGWGKLSKNLKAEIDEDLIEAYRGIESLPFTVSFNTKIAVKIVDDRGIESLKILEVN